MSSTINANTSAIKIITDTSNTLILQTNSISCMYASNGIISFTSNGAITLPSGNWSFRPANPSLGMIRYDSGNSHIEIYKSTGWAIFV